LPSSSSSETTSVPPEPRSNPWGLSSWLPLVGLLLFSFAALVANARVKPFVIDETLGFPLISQPSLHAIVHFESTTPLWFDPPAFAMLVHTSWRLFGASALALRLPSIGSILILIAALYFLLRRIAGQRAALFVTLLAVTFPAFDFGWQERPYALIMAMVAIAALCWHCASHQPGKGTARRWLPLAGLFLALTIAINSHYFAIFATLPFLLAELVRTIERRRFDFPVILTLVLACCSALLTLPFRRAIMQYRGHVITGDLNWSQIPHTYQITLPGPPTVWLEHIFHTALVLFVVGVLLGSAWKFKGRNDWSSWTLVAGLTLTPILTVAFAIYVLHAYRERYAIFQFVGLMLLLGIVAGPWLNGMRRPVYLTVLVILCGYVIQHHVQLNSDIKEDARVELANMEPSDNVRAMLLQNPDLPVFAPVESCLLESFYGSSLTRQHMICVYSAEREILYSHTDTVARTSMVLATQPGFHIVPYETMIATPGPRLLVERREHNEPWEIWIEKSLQADGVHITPIGNGLSGVELELSTSHQTPGRLEDGSAHTLE
jgi:Dolichyl-phosphate-mannose-protein mannosyltransferase